MKIYILYTRKLESEEWEECVIKTDRSKLPSPSLFTSPLSGERSDVKIMEFDVVNGVTIEEAQAEPIDKKVICYCFECGEPIYRNPFELELPVRVGDYKVVLKKMRFCNKDCAIPRLNTIWWR